MNRLLHNGFLANAAAYPGRVALRHEATTWTYGELLDRALAISAAIPEEADEGYRPIVAVLGTKSPGSIAAILGALCAGHAYSTIAPGSPRIRIEAALRALRPTVLVTTGLSPDLRHTLRVVEAPPAALLDLGGDLPGDAFPRIPRLHTAAPGPVKSPVSGGNAYVLFTSGSTGIPKGACVSHRAACLAVDMFLERHPLVVSDRVGNQVELCFDLSMLDIFTTLSSGAELQLLPAIASEPSLFFQALADSGITSVFTVPSVVEQATLECPSIPTALRLRRLLLSGESLTAGLLGRLARLLPAAVEIWNLYGGTEMPYVLAKRVSPHAFDQANTLTDFGPNVELSVRRLSNGPDPGTSDGREVGELVIRGPGIFSGYLDSTSAQLPPPVEAHFTGDVVRIEPGGGYTILGRRDRQVKIDGVRVELDAIERALESHPDVAESAVIPSPDRLEVIAFVVSRQQAPASLLEELEEFCEERLLPVECPCEYRLLPRLPRTPSGKKDRRSLSTDGAFA